MTIELQGYLSQNYITYGALSFSRCSEFLYCYTGVTGNMSADFLVNGSQYLGVNTPQTMLASAAVFTQMIFTGFWGFLSCSSQVPVIGYSTAYIDGTTYEQTSLTWPFTPTASPQLLDMRFGFDDITLNLATPLHTIGIVYFFSNYI